MIDDNDIFLENIANIINKGLFGIIVTYDVLLNPKLDVIMKGQKNVILNSKIGKNLFPEYLDGWIILRDCYVDNTIYYNNFVSYTIYFKKIEDITSIYLQRKIKLKMLMGNKQLLQKTI